MRPRLSFVVPVYNPTPEVFDAHLRSMLEQSLTEWDAVYVLDGPQPGARSVLDKYIKSKDKRWAKAKDLVIIEIPHSGAPVARNAGKAQVSGASEFICFFDADCVIEPGAAKAWVQMFDKYPQALFVYASYKFIGDVGAVPTLPWNPYVLRTRNFISGCFPVRKAYCPNWNPSLKSLQDWDFWLSVLDKAEAEGLDTQKIGKMMVGYAFKTEPPKAGSISGEGCRNEVWLDRMDSVKKAHNLPDKSICVASLDYPDESVRLAQILGADFWPFPGDKPHRYKTLIQVGYSLRQEKQEAHAGIFQAATDARKAIFFTSQDIDDLWTMVNFSTLIAYRKIFDSGRIELYCEDKKAQDLLAEVGFKAEILPLPLSDGPKVKPLPEKPKILLDYGDEYRDLMVALNVALPDYELVTVKEGKAVSIYEYSALVHFYRDRSLSNSMKRAHLTGRHVISNVQAPFCGYTGDKDNAEVTLKDVVHKVRNLRGVTPNEKAADYYAKACSPEKVRAKFAQEVAA